MARRERIAVTGLGLVSSLGFGRELSFARLCAGERGMGPVSLFDTRGLKSQIAAEVKGLDVPAIAPRGEDWSRSDALAFVAAREALSQARHAPGAALGLALGGTTGGMYETERALEKIAPGEISPQDARRLLDFPLAVSVERVSRALGSVAQSATVCSACSSGAVALALAASWLLAGRVERVVAGGVDGLCQLTFAGFNALGAVDPAPCRPFDASRAGLTLGEGAGCLVLELESSALARGVPVIAFLSGWALASEAHHITHPEPSGARAARVLLDAIRVAGLEPRDIDYVNAHGTGTLQNDAMEAKAIERVFESDLGRVWLSSSKGQLGHTLGAAGAIEAAITALSLNLGVVPPTAGLTQPELTTLRHVRAPNQAAELRAALSSSFGFGGACAVLAFEAPTAEPRALELRARSSIVISGAASFGLRGLLGGTDSASYLTDAAAPSEPAPEPLSLLDPDRSRRFGRASALVVASAERALRDAQLDSAGIGFVVGSAFGDVDRSVRFLQKVLSQGPKFASPAEFPQLIASTGSGNASIYLGLTGPCLSVSEFATSGESAVSVALSLLELGVAPAVLAGSGEAHDPIVDAVLGGAQRVARSEGAGFVVLEALADAQRRGRTPLALLTEHRAVRGDPAPALLSLSAPPASACVVTSFLPSAAAGALARSAWSGVRVHVLPSVLGFHEALGAVALSVATSEVASGRVEEALVVTADVDTLYLTRLARYVETI
ncbi:MAG TPA: beta-ketoacyl-[acyl-carrier-protein] synthase family protein [Polyangiaceae bacterium]|jgi:3-oxoacyl-[acyl-carrier-protein] synthase II|nr:beta-ketoacyl-[acyl-carrier-protein] synthase family protein [Polyangiaceae bacterium]